MIASAAPAGEEVVRRLRHAFFAGLVVQATAAGAIEVGQLAPDFTLNDIAGAPHSLSALRGKAVLLAFIGYG
jgi:hypothetical protein